jgi:glycosyltransferase involved in cell wall biosynthesis
VIPIFLDQHNVDQEYWGRKVKFSKTILHKIISFVNLKKTIHFEKSLLSKINTYISVSELDRKNTIKYAFPIVKNFLVAPNGVNIHEYKNINHILTRSKKITLGFLGSMNLEINQNAAFQIVESILPDVKIALPDFTIQLMIIGKDPPDSIRNLEKNNEIFVTGTVESTKMYLEKINIFICPIIGGAGTKLRLFEVMSLGIPSVGYPYLFQGVEEIVHGHNAFIANNLEEFINYTIILSKNSDLREKIGVNARDMIVKNYDWNRITKKLSADIELILKNNQN